MDWLKVASQIRTLTYAPQLNMSVKHSNLKATFPTERASLNVFVIPRSASERVPVTQNRKA